MESGTQMSETCRFVSDGNKSVMVSCNGEINDTAANNTFYDDFSYHVEVWHIIHQLNMFYVPLLIAVGFVGNLLSCVVFLNTRLRMRSSSYYLAALAIADVTYLFVLFLVWLDQLGYQTFNVHGFCQLEIYIGSVSSTLSVWLTVAFTVERFIAVQYPLQRPTVCTVHRAKTIIFCLAFAAACSYVYIFVTAGVVEHSKGVFVCDLRESYRQLMNYINWADTLFTLVIPLFMIGIMNTLIARQLLKFSRRFRDRDSGLSNIQESERPLSISAKKASAARCSHNSNSQCMCSSHNSYAGHHPRIPLHSQPSHHHSLTSSSTSKSNNNNAALKPTFANAAYVLSQHKKETQKSILSTRTQYSITKMLLLTSTVFMILNLPSHVIRLHYWVITGVLHQEISGPSEQVIWNLQQLCMLLQYTHFSINFVFYSTCGSTFRKCLMQLLPIRMRACCRSAYNSQHYQ